MAETTTRADADLTQFLAEKVLGKVFHEYEPELTHPCHQPPAMSFMNGRLTIALAQYAHRYWDPINSNDDCHEMLEALPEDWDVEIWLGAHVSVYVGETRHWCADEDGWRRAACLAAAQAYGFAPTPTEAPR